MKMQHKIQQTDDLSALPVRKRRQGQRMTPEEKQTAKDTFLKAYSRTANITLSCAAAHIHRDTFYVWTEHDAEFGLRYHQAETEAADTLQAIAWNMGTKGTEEPVVSMGRVVMTKKFNPQTGKDEEVPLMKKVYHPQVLLRLMSWKIPGFREKQQIEVSGPDGGPLQHSVEIYRVKIPHNDRDELKTES